VLRFGHMFEDFIPGLLGKLPASWRKRIIGRPDSPSHFATFAHNLLNRIPHAESQIFDCKGALEGYRMRIDWTRFRSFIYGTWEPEVLGAVTSTVTPGMTVIDIGAHIGYYTLLFAKLAGADGRIISFEPFPQNFALLKENVGLNHLDHVLVLPQAVFSRDDEIMLTVPDELHNSGEASVAQTPGTAQLRVQALTLDSYCGSASVQPDFLKMDVEGAEYDVLLGARETITRCHPKLLIELHHFDGNTAAHPVPELLDSWGYDVQWLERSLMTSHILALPEPAVISNSVSLHPQVATQLP
jgi:FkbM family methyltransferase